MELRVGNKYRLGRKIGSGSFGDIYLEVYATRVTYADMLRDWATCLLSEYKWRSITYGCIHLDKGL
ncbi:hypothetical protein FKM82_024848 [Ascaphus truei]